MRGRYCRRAHAQDGSPTSGTLSAINLAAAEATESPQCSSLSGSPHGLGTVLFCLHSPLFSIASHTTAISSKPETTAGASRTVLTITKQPALAPSPQPRPAPTARALPSALVAQRGPFWAPIRGPD